MKVFGASSKFVSVWYTRHWCFKCKNNFR